MTWGVVALACFALAAWCTTFLLVRRAFIRPYIGVLSERAGIAVLFSLLGTASALFLWNSDHGYVLLDRDAQRIAFTLLMIAMLTVPSLWFLVLYATDRLGGDDE